MAVTLIKSYKIQFSSNGFVPRIALYDKDENKIGRLVFYPDDTKLPSDRQEPRGEVTVMYKMNQYPMLVDILRNENPVYLVFNGTDQHSENGVRTDLEPIGEGERCFTDRNF